MSTVIKSLFDVSNEKSYMKLSIRFGANIHNSIIRMILLTVINLYITVEIFVMAIFIYGIRKKVLGFVAFRVTSKILGIGYVERSWVDVKTIKSVNTSALGSNISENQSIVYTSSCVE